jgi:5'-AMP-activated protein kinase, regulatory gamma subunit
MNLTSDVKMLPGNNAGTNEGAAASSTLMTAEETRVEGRRVIKAFLQQHTCYDLIPRSGKVIVFDVDIPIKLCFYALVEHGVASAPLLDPTTNQFVGMFTATDFIEIIRYFYKRGSFTEAITDYSIHAWRSMKNNDAQIPSTLISLSTRGTLYEACMQMREHKIHRMPIMHPRQNSVLGVASHLDVLKYLVARFQEERRLFDQCIFDLGIGQFRNVIIAKDNTPLIDVLELFVDNRISSVPIVSASTGSLKDIYCSSYVTHLGRDTSPGALQMPVGEVLSKARANNEFGEIENLHTCNKRESLHNLFQCFAASRSHRVVCVDEEGFCEGIISLSDLLNYFLDDDEVGEDAPGAKGGLQQSTSPRALNSAPGFQGNGEMSIDDSG